MTRGRIGKTLRVTAASAVGLLGLVVLAPPASAGETDCASGYFCVWKDTNYKTSGAGGAWVRFGSLNSNYYYSYYNGTSTRASGNITSLVNRSSAGNDVFIYKGAHGSGARYAIAPGSGRSNLATSISPWGWNDSITSAYFAPYDPNS